MQLANRVTPRDWSGSHMEIKLQSDQVRGSSDISTDDGSSNVSSFVSRVRRTHRPTSTATSVVKEKLGPNEFIVQRVIQYKIHNKVRWALVKWKGFKKPTWEPADTIFYYKSPGEVIPQAREADYLVDRRTKRGVIEYKVHWKDLPSKRDSWIRKSKLARQDLVDKYLEKHPALEDIEENPVVLRLSRSKVQRNWTAGSNVSSTAGITSDIPGRHQLELPEKSEKPVVTPDGIANVQEPVKLSGKKQSRGSGRVSIKKGESVQKGEEHVELESGLIRLVPLPIESPIKEQNIGHDGAEREEVVKQPDLEDKPVDEWTVPEVADFLTRKGFSDTALKLQAREVDGKGLMENLDPLALRSMAIPVGQSLKIVKLMRDLQRSRTSIQLLIRHS